MDLYDVEMSPEIVLVAQADVVEAAQGGSADDDLHARARQALRDALEMSIDDPRLRRLTEYPPDDLLKAAFDISVEMGTPRPILFPLLAALSSLDLELQSDEGQEEADSKRSFFERWRRRALKSRPEKHALVSPWLDALTRYFHTPDIVEVARLSYRSIESDSSEGQGDIIDDQGRRWPAPRKLLIDEEGRVRHPELGAAGGLVLSRRHGDRERAELRAPYPRFLFSLGRYHAMKGELTNAYLCYANGIELDYEAWKAVEPVHGESFLQAAAFMVLSAHRTEEVTELFAQYPLDRAGLQRRIVDQIKRRTEIYTRARGEAVNNAAISQALADLLNTLIEDPSIQNLISEEERLHFLKLIGEAASSHRQYQEAIGVYAAMQDRDALIGLGRKLSARIYYVRGDTILINRDVEAAIDAFREAGAASEMRALLRRCLRARDELDARSEEVENRSFLALYIRRLEEAVGGGEDGASLGIARKGGDSDAREDASVETEAPLSDERLEELIDVHRDRVERALPGQDVSEDRRMLARLADEAAARGNGELAIRALEPLGGQASQELLALGRKMIALDRYAVAYAALTRAGAIARADLISLGDRIVAGGLAPRGVFAPEVEYAVRAWLDAGADERLESLLNDLIKLRIDLHVLDGGGPFPVPPPKSRHRDVLERCIDLIADAYDLQGVKMDGGTVKADGSSP